MSGGSYLIRGIKLGQVWAGFSGGLELRRGFYAQKMIAQMFLWIPAVINHPTSVGGNVLLNHNHQTPPLNEENRVGPEYEHNLGSEHSLFDVTLA